MDLADIPRGPDCPRCRKAMILEHSKHGVFYLCLTCDVTHGAHADGRPLGIPGDKITRMARKTAHEVFDRLWRGERMSRSAAYRWMRRTMGMTRAEAHIGRFTVEQCWRLVRAVAEFEKRLAG